MPTRSLLLSIILLAGCAQPQPEYIVSKGSATIKVPIDYLEISIAIESNHSSLTVADEKTRELVLKMFEVFKSFSIPDSDFVTTRSETQEEFIYDSPERKKLYVFYAGMLTLRQPASYDALFRRLVSLGNLKIEIKNYGSYKLQEYSAQAYQEAIATAERQADLMIAGTGQTRGRILKLLQDHSDPFSHYDQIQESAQGPFITAIEHTKMAPDKIPVTFRRTHFDKSANVTVIYALEH